MADVPIFIHLLGVVTPLAISITYFNGGLFSAHVILMSFTYLFVIPEGIIMAVKAVRVCLQTPDLDHVTTMVQFLRSSDCELLLKYAGHQPQQ